MCTCGDTLAWLVIYGLALFAAPYVIGIALTPFVALVVFLKSLEI
jgi:hypothetical protein